MAYGVTVHSPIPHEQPLLVDRSAHLRDTADLAAATAIVVHDGAVLADGGGPVRVRPEDRPRSSLTVYLGRADGEDLVAVVAAEEPTAPAAAEEAGDAGLTAECLLELGTALVHAVHSHDDEGAVVLAGAIAAATEAGHDAVASRALAEVGYVDVLSGRRVTAALHLEWAREVAGEDRGLLATVASFEGADLHDRGRLDEAAARFRESIADAHATGKARREAWALGVGARTMYWRGELVEARDWATRALEIIAQERWTAYQPWVEAWRAQTELALGRDPGEVRADLEATFALSCQLSDACWQGMSAKVMALACAAQGQREDAELWMRTAAASCSRETDAYVWVRADVALEHAALALGWGDLDAARALAEDARAIAARAGLEAMLGGATALIDRAEPPRRSLGIPSAIGAVGPA